MAKFTKTVVENRLLSGTKRVTFTKTDGSTRVMDATLCPKALSAASTSYVPNANSSVVVMYDTTKQGWRSARTDLITNIEDLVAPAASSAS